jgi:serine/threonine protein kinase
MMARGVTDDPQDLPPTVDPTVTDGSQPTRRSRAFADWSGRDVGRYRLESIVGKGGMAAVYAARDTVLDRRVAVKVPHGTCFSCDDSRDKFLREARVAASLQHDGLVTIHDVGSLDDGHPYLVMEFIEGRSLAQELSKGPLPLRRALAIAADVAEAVHCVHENNLVHRDLKPANVLVDCDGRPHVTDFGLALHEDVQSEFVGDISGTLPYMAPEQVRGEAHRLDGRSDIWALGVMLYEMLTGRRPFRGNTANEVFDEILWRAPKPPRQIDDRIPEAVEAICLKCLAKDVDDRYTSAASLVDDLRRELVLLGDGTQTPEDSPSETMKRTGREFVAQLNFGKFGCGLTMTLASLLLVVGVAILRNRAPYELAQHDSARSGAPKQQGGSDENDVKINSRAVRQRMDPPTPAPVDVPAEPAPPAVDVTGDWRAADGFPLKISRKGKWLVLQMSDPATRIQAELERAEDGSYFGKGFIVYAEDASKSQRIVAMKLIVDPATPDKLTMKLLAPAPDFDERGQIRDANPVEQEIQWSRKR